MQNFLWFLQCCNKHENQEFAFVGYISSVSIFHPSPQLPSAFFPTFTFLALCPPPLHTFQNPPQAFPHKSAENLQINTLANWKCCTSEIRFRHRDIFMSNQMLGPFWIKISRNLIVIVKILELDGVICFIQFL